MGKAEVVIIGAGAAGLAAARGLSRAGRPCTVLEARDRIGGRIETLGPSRFGQPVDLGAEFVHGRPDATWRLIREAGLTAYEVPFEHWRWHAGRLSKAADYTDELSHVLGPLSRLRHDVSFAQYLRQSRGTPGAEATRFALDFVMGFDAADPERISAKSIAAEQEGLGDVGDEMQFRLLQGQGSLVEFLAAEAFGGSSRLILSSRVREVEWTHGRVRIRAETGPRRKPLELTAAAAIVTVPLGILQAPPSSPSAIRFVPELHEKQRAIGTLGFGPIVKVVLKLREPFWEDAPTRRATRAGKELADASFLHLPSAPFPTWWTARPLRLSLLTGWAGGPRASKLSGLSRSELERAAVESLASLFRRRPRVIASLVERLVVRDWSVDPFALGAYSYECVGGLRSRGLLARPLKRTLFFAGEATDTEGQASTVAGALASGERAAREVIRALG